MKIGWRVGDRGEPLSAPTRKVGDEDVGPQVQLRLVEDPPSPRPPSSALVGGVEIPAKHARRHGVLRGRAGVHMQLTVDDLGDQVVGDLQQVRIGCRATGVRRHVA